MYKFYHTIATVYCTLYNVNVTMYVYLSVPFVCFLYFSFKIYLHSLKQKDHTELQVKY
jgi:hypothetical protein